MKNRYKSLWLAFAVLFLVPCLTAQEEQTAVIPAELENVEGPGWSFQPFNNQIDNVRVQFHYPNTAFVDAMPVGGTISEIAFRLDGPNGSPGFPPGGSLDTQMELELRASTSVSVPNPFLPLEFAQNVGPNETIVFPRQVLLLKSMWNSTGPNEFSIRIPFDNEFVYNPNEGHLLLDFFIYRAPGQRVVVEPGGGDALLIGSINSPTATDVGVGGAAMQITYVPVPEPGVLGLLAAAVIAFRLLRNKP